MLKVVLALYLISVAFTAPAQKSGLSKKLNYQRSMGSPNGAYKVYQADPYQASPYQEAPYQASPYQGAPYQASPYQGAPYQASPYQGAPYQEAYKSYTPITWTETVSADPYPVELDDERKNLIKAVNEAFKFRPFLYGNSKSVEPVNMNYDFTSFGSGTFQYYTPRNQNTYVSPSYTKSSPSYQENSYEPSYPEKTNYQKPRYNVPKYQQSYQKSYNQPSYQPSYSAPEYKPSYSAPEYKPSYSTPEYKPSYSAPEYKPSYSAPEYKPY